VNSTSRHVIGLGRVALAVALAAAVSAVAAHGTKVGDIAIGHPFATPSLAGSANGAVYFASLENTGTVADRLVSATTPAAARVELHAMAVDAQGVMRMRELDAMALAPKAKLLMRAGNGLHLMLIGLTAPLKEGDSFPMTLRFERAGTVDVKVVVDRPRPATAAEGHMH
jgi:copper(I)-binding protein